MGRKFFRAAVLSVVLVAGAIGQVAAIALGVTLVATSSSAFAQSRVEVASQRQHLQAGLRAQ